MYKEAHQNLERLNLKKPEANDTLKVDNDLMMYLEYILVAKKVFVKSYFLQRAYELLQLGNSLCFKASENDKDKASELDYYWYKINEYMANLYTDQFFYQVAKKHMEKAKEIIEKGNLTELDKCKHELKYANFLKRSGYYTKATELIVTLENKIYLIGDNFEKEFKFRVMRDKARALAISNRVDESMESFDKAENMLNCNKKNVKYGKCLYLRGLASKRISNEAAIERFE